MTPFDCNTSAMVMRLRVERQLGYKMAKYVMRIEAIESFAGLGRGRGGFWEDRGYEWYAGVKRLAASRHAKLDLARSKHSAASQLADR